MIALRFWLKWQRFCTWLNGGDTALNLTAIWTIPVLLGIILALEFGA